MKLDTIIENPSKDLAFDNEIFSCLSQISFINEEEMKEITEWIEIKEFKKGTHILKEGQILSRSYSVIKGCVRQYYLLDGEERTTFFFTEDQNILSLSVEAEGKPSKFNLVCTEDTLVTTISKENQSNLYKKFPQFEAMNRKSLEEELKGYHELMINFMTTTPEDRYLEIRKTNPSLLNRVPQYQLASYLGIKPESLSRIRRRLVS